MSPVAIAWRTVAITLLVAASFAVSARLALPLSVRRSHPDTPAWFPVVVTTAHGGVTIADYGALSNGGQAGGARYTFTPDEVASLNAALVSDERCRGAHWAFEVTQRVGARQYIHVTKAGDDDILESWYWATADGIEPVAHRWLNIGVLFIVAPLTAFFVLSGIVAYRAVRRLLRQWRAN